MPLSDGEIILDHTTVTSISNPAAEVEVLTVQVPGVAGPAGAQGAPGQANVLTIGTVTTGTVGSPAAATISGVSPNQVLNLTIPQGPVGATGPANTLSIGTVTTLASGSSATATITGTAPTQTLNLGIPQGVAGTVADATTSSKGQVQLAGDLGGTAAAPTVPTKLSLSGGTMTGKLQVPGVGIGTANDNAYPLEVYAGNANSALWAASYQNGNTVDSGSAVGFGFSVNNVLLVKGGVAFERTGAYGLGSVHFLVNNTSDNTTVASLSDKGFTVDHNKNVTLYGPLNMGTQKITSVVDPTSAQDAATKNYTDTQVATKASIAGDLGGTAASPQVTGGTHHGHTSSQISDAASAATASKVIIRDANGRASVADPSASTDIATKNYTDTQVATKASIAGDLGGTAAAPTVTGGTHHTHTSSQISDAASAGTASTVVIRDSAGRAQMVDPSAAQDVATKNYVDTRGVSTATASSLIKRDGSARAQVADPAVAADISTKNYTDTQDVAMRRPAVFAKTANYTAQLTDERMLIQMNSASATTFTIPPNANVAFSVGTVIQVQMLGTGSVTIAPGAGVTINTASGSLVMTRQYSVVQLQKTASDTWNVESLSNATATSSGTANTLALRDSSGQATFATVLVSNASPSLSNELTRKDYVDGKLPGKITVGTTAPSTPSTNDIWVDTN